MTYDENQQDTRLVQCSSCQRAFFMRPWHVRCVECRGWPHVAASRDPPARDVRDLNGLVMYEP